MKKHSIKQRIQPVPVFNRTRYCTRGTPYLASVFERTVDYIEARMPRTTDEPPLIIHLFDATTKQGGAFNRALRDRFHSDSRIVFKYVDPEKWAM